MSTQLPDSDTRLMRYQEERDSAAETLRRIEQGWRFFEKLGYQPQLDTTDKHEAQAQRMIALMDDLIARGGA
jgi:hypothetical protein